MEAAGRHVDGLGDFDGQPVGVGERDHSGTKPLLWSVKVDIVLRQKVHPCVKARCIRGVGHGRGHAVTRLSGSGTDEGKEGHDSPRRSGAVPVVKMIRAGIVKVDRLLHQPLAKRAGIEIEIGLRGIADGGDMVQPRDGGHVW